MGIETSTNIEGLDNTWPLNGDFAAQGGEHIRLLKSILQDTFPNFTAEAVASTPTEWNYLQGATSNIQVQIDTSNNSSLPLGSVMMWNSLNAVPQGWFVCDGANGTPDLTNRFIMGATDEADIGTVGGFADQAVITHDHTQTHSHSWSFDAVPDHTHDFITALDRTTGAANKGTYRGPDFKQFGYTVDTVADHYHVPSALENPEVSSSEGTGTLANQNFPAYYKLVYIKRIS